MELEPIFVNRLESLADANEMQEDELRAGISMGKFDKKWGSLPVALWLHSEVKRCGEQKTMQSVFRLERSSVLALAERHIQPELLPRVKALQEHTDIDSASPTCVADMTNR
jgi:hypothetical protein